MDHRIGTNGWWLTHVPRRVSITVEKNFPIPRRTSMLWRKSCSSKLLPPAPRRDNEVVSGEQRERRIGPLGRPAKVDRHAPLGTKRSPAVKPFF